MTYTAWKRGSVTCRSNPHNKHFKYYIEEKESHGSPQDLNWIGKNLVNCDDLRRMGKALTGQFEGSWKHRVGDYRILAEIHDDELIILLIEIGHRSTAYN